MTGAMTGAFVELGRFRKSWAEHIVVGRCRTACSTQFTHHEEPTKRRLVAFTRRLLTEERLCMQCARVAGTWMLTPLG